MNAVEIAVIVVDKVVPNVLVDGGSGLNILPEPTMKKLDLSLLGITLRHQYGQPKTFNASMDDYTIVES